MDRKTLDRLVSGSGLVVAVVLVLLGAAAIFGGSFGRNNVRDQLIPQHIQFPPAEAMSPEESAEVGEFAGQKVATGDQAEAFSRYIGLHLAEVNEGKTYSETSSEARALDPEDPAKPEKDAQVMTLFRGETLRGLLLGAYGWWTISTLALYAGYGLIAAGIVLAVLAALGFRHAKTVELKIAKPEKAAA
jgi:hypothetical protein